VGGQVALFMTEHLGQPIPSPAVMAKIGDRFRAAVTRFCDESDIPMLRFDGHQRQIDVVRPFLDAATGPGVVAVGVAQEFQSVFTDLQAADRQPQRRVLRVHQDGSAGDQLLLLRARRRVRARVRQAVQLLPYPGKVWVNGHEWAKRQAAKVGVGFEELANGFASCDDPVWLQKICDRLAARHIQAFFERWMKVIPTPLSIRDRKGGYWWELSMRQIEVSRTLVFDAPRRARAFFEATVADNLDIGRPDEVKLIFDRQIRSTTKGEFATKVVTRGTDVTVNVFYKHSRKGVPEGGSRPADRDGGQQPHRPRGATTPSQPRRAGDRGQSGQPSPPRRPACRPGLCHRDRSVRADLTALA